MHSSQSNQQSRAPENIRFASPPRRAPTNQRSQTPNVDDILNSFAAGPPEQSLPRSKVSEESLHPTSGMLSPSPSNKVFGQAHQPTIGQMEHSRLSVYSQAAEIAGDSPSASPTKNQFQLQRDHYPQPRDRDRELSDIAETSAEGSAVPDVVVRSDSRQEEHYIFNGASLAQESPQPSRKMSVGQPPRVVDRQESLKQKKTRQSTADTSFNVGKAFLNSSQGDTSSVDFLPSFRDSSIDQGHGFLTLQQMAMSQQHADFNTYRSPTYSIYGAYAVSSSHSAFWR